MNILPTIIPSSPRNLAAALPTDDLRLEIIHHRRCTYAHSMHT